MNNNQLIIKILNKYQIKDFEILSPQKGYRNTSYPIETSDGRKLNLIIYKNERGILQKIKHANIVSDYLASKGMSTREVIHPPNKNSVVNPTVLVIRSSSTTRYACLYNYLPGETIPWEAYTMKHIKLLGMTMAEMHRKLRITNNELRNKLQILDLPCLPTRQGLPIASAEILYLVNKMQIYFGDENVQNALKEKLSIKLNKEIWKDFDQLVARLKQIPAEHYQILHMDFVRSNVLFFEKSSEFRVQSLKKDDSLDPKPLTLNLNISGILDFEKVSYGPKIIDIARTLAFLIVDSKYKTEEKVRKYFLKSGYIKHGQGKVDNLDLLENLMQFFWFYDFYKFLKHNPYEFLRQNEHFIRTISKLNFK